MDGFLGIMGRRRRYYSASHRLRIKPGFVAKADRARAPCVGFLFPLLLIRIFVIFWTCVCFLSASSERYPEDGAGAQATAHSERIKAWSAAKRFQAISQASMISARVRNTELASQWLRR